MRIADICTHTVVDAPGNISVRAAAELMRKEHVGSLVIVEHADGERFPTGFITDRDIVLAVVAAGVETASLTVADIMSRDIATCSENMEIFSAIETMRHHCVRRLPVLNSKGGLAGMLSADDIYSALSTHMRALTEALTREQENEIQVRV